MAETMGMTWDTRDGARRSFADCLVAPRRPYNGDETWLMSAKEYSGVAPAEAVQACGQWDRDRTSITGVVSAGCFGTILPLYFIKKGKLWT